MVSTRTELLKKEITIAGKAYNVRIARDVRFGIDNPYIWSIIRKDLKYAHSNRAAQFTDARAALDGHITFLRNMYAVGGEVVNLGSLG
jgi:hypothetical protein